MSDSFRTIVEQIIGTLQFNGQAMTYGLGLDKLIDNNSYPIGWLSFIEAQDQVGEYRVNQRYNIEVDFAGIGANQVGQDISPVEHKALCEEGERVARAFTTALLNHPAVIDVSGVRLPTLEFFLNENAFGAQFRGTVTLQYGYSC